MSEAQELLDAAVVALYDDGCITPPRTEHAQHVVEALRLPDYEAAVEALEAVLESQHGARLDVTPFPPCVCGTHKNARAALRRLRDDR